MTDTYSCPAGSPCWVETLQPDPDAAVAFYGELMGWTFGEPGANGYRSAQIGGRRVAGIWQAPAMLDRGAWVTYMLVSDLDQTVAAVVEASGVVISSPVYGEDGGRRALFTDPSGAAFGAIQGSTPIVADVVDVPGAWQMSALHTPDLMVAQAFYATVFGWSLEPALGTGISLWHLPGSTRRATDPTLADDVVAVAARADPRAGVPPH